MYGFLIFFYILDKVKTEYCRSVTILTNTEINLFHPKIHKFHLRIVEFRHFFQVDIIKRLLEMLYFATNNDSKLFNQISDHIIVFTCFPATFGTSSTIEH